MTTSISAWSRLWIEGDLGLKVKVKDIRRNGLCTLSVPEPVDLSLSMTLTLRYFYTQSNSFVDDGSVSMEGVRS